MSSPAVVPDDVKVVAVVKKRRGRPPKALSLAPKLVQVSAKKTSTASSYSQKSSQKSQKQSKPAKATTAAPTTVRIPCIKIKEMYPRPKKMWEDRWNQQQAEAAAEQEREKAAAKAARKAERALKKEQKELRKKAKEAKEAALAEAARIAAEREEMQIQRIGRAQSIPSVRVYRRLLDISGYSYDNQPPTPKS